MEMNECNTCIRNIRKWMACEEIISAYKITTITTIFKKTPTRSSSFCFLEQLLVLENRFDSYLVLKFTFRRLVMEDFLFSFCVQSPPLSLIILFFVAYIHMENIRLFITMLDLASTTLKPADSLNFATSLLGGDWR